MVVQFELDFGSVCLLSKKWCRLTFSTLSDLSDFIDVVFILEKHQMTFVQIFNLFFFISFSSVIFFPKQENSKHFYSEQSDHLLNTVVSYGCWVKAVVDSQLIYLEIWFFYPDSSLFPSYLWKENQNKTRHPRNNRSWDAVWFAGSQLHPFLRT